VNFFQQQEHARRTSRRLTLLFLLSVAAVVLALDAAAYVAGARQTGCLAVAVAALACITGGSLYRMSQLGTGGAAVAQMCGGRRIQRTTADPVERRLLNIMEEMALASGIPVPQAYVLEGEPGINAFAAGLSPGNAVVTVTSGALDKLSRDELQGVIGHEFSHILNGDMRLNLRLIGLLAGIELIAVIGLRMLRASPASRGRNSLQLAPVGLVLVIAGYAGKLCADITRAAVSRQREFLADASAVQFTRNPGGIAAALARIGREGGAIGHPCAGEIAHMCLSDVSPVSAMRLFATHPPLEERIARLIGPAGAQRLRRSSPLAQLTARSVVGSIGRPAPEHLGQAASLLARIPRRLDAALRSEPGAKALIAALLYEEAGTEEVETGVWTAQGEGPTAQLARELRPEVRELGDAARLPLVDLALPVLKAMPPPARAAFLALVRRSVAAGSRFTYFDLDLLIILERQLADAARPAAAPRFSSLRALQSEAVLVLSVVAHAARADAAVFARVAARIGCPAVMMPAEQIGFAPLHAALNRLLELAPLEKPALIKAAAEIVLADGAVSLREFELMRAICSAIDSPVPPAVDHPVPLGRPKQIRQSKLEPAQEQ
jgi:Zn-dependent protease with chaperone function